MTNEIQRAMVETKLHLPYISVIGDWNVLSETKNGRPRTAIEPEKKLGVAITSPVNGPGKERHPIREIAAFKTDTEWIVIAWFDFLKNAQSWISGWDIETHIVSEDEWKENYDQFIEQVTTTDIVLFIEPNQKYVPNSSKERYWGFKGEYAGALQSFSNYEQAVSRWGLDGFEILHDRKDQVERSLRTLDLQDTFFGDRMRDSDGQ